MMISVYDRVENIVEKGENAGSHKEFLFSSCIYFVICKINAFNLDQSKNLLFGKGLTDLLIFW